MAIQSVFERIEEKYQLSARERAAIEGALAAHLQRDRARDGLVCSLYLDTPERAVIMRSLEKPCYKEKLRLRAYGTVLASFSPTRAFQVVNVSAPGLGEGQECQLLVNGAATAFTASTAPSQVGGPAGSFDGKDGREGAGQPPEPPGGAGGQGGANGREPLEGRPPQGGAQQA